MPAEESTDQVRVITYIPAEQKSTWKSHAEELGMSQAEFVRTMVQAGRKEFTLKSQNNVEPDSPDTDPGGDDLETGVLNALKLNGPLSWDELCNQLSNDFEDRLETCLESLQQQNQIQYSGRAGGYTAIDE